MDEMYKDIYKKLMTLQWLLRRYQMMNCKEHNIYENRIKENREFSNDIYPMKLQINYLDFVYEK